MVSEIKFSIIVPIFNEARHLESTVNDLLVSLKGNNIKCNIILVNDGSTDHSNHVIEKIISHEGSAGLISSINLAENRGIGYVYKEALKVIDTKYVTWIPSDGEIPAKYLIEALLKVNADDLIISYPSYEKNPRSYIRSILSKTYTVVLNKSFSLKLRYFNGFTVFPTKVIKSLNIRSDRFGFNAEAVIKALKIYGLNYQQVSFSLTARRSGKSKAITFKSLFDVLKFYITTFIDIHFQQSGITND